MHEDPDFVQCAFCRRLSVGHFLIENEQTVVFRDAHPLTRGHIHIVPRRHTRNFFRIPPHSEDDMWEALRQSQRWLEKELGPDGYSVGINIGEAAGQTISHANIHLIPRYSADLLDLPRGARWVLGGKHSKSPKWKIQDALQGEVLLEQKRSLALAHPYPISPGHTIIAPRRQETNFFALSAADQDHLWSAVGKTAEIIEKEHSPDGYNVVIDVGKAAGQEIPLALIHLVPRYQGDAKEPFGVRWMAGEHSDYQKRGIGH